MRERAGRLAALCAVVVAACCLLAQAASASAPVWATPAEFTQLPAGANTTPGTAGAAFRAVSCTSSGNCAAVGLYVVTSSVNELMVATETNGSWGPATELAVPAGRSAYSVGNLSCPSTGNCAAVGTLQSAADGGIQKTPFVLDEVNGSWQPVDGSITLPSDAGPSPLAGLDSVSCTSAGNCVAVGYYTNQYFWANAMYLTESGGTWASAASSMTLPADAVEGCANCGGTGIGAVLNAVSCPSAGNCVATGHYVSSAGGQRAMIATEVGIFGWVVNAYTATPGNAGTAGASGPSHLGAGFDSGLDCTGVGNCVAAGIYLDSAGDAEMMVATETNGSWQQAIGIPLPAAVTGSSVYPDGTAYVTALSCSAPGECAATGYYTDNSSDTLAMTVDETGGVWGLTSEVMPPGNATSTSGSEDVQLDGLACTAPGACVAGGSYVDSGANTDAMLISSLPQLTVTTSSLPRASGGSGYSAQLGASGGSGAYAWSVSSGSLPAGLALNAATGLISGTPTGSGSSFTVTVSDPGPPAQSASQSLSISVAAPPPPAPVVAPPVPPAPVATPITTPLQASTASIGRALVEKLSASVPISCSAGGGCAVSIRLLVRETLEHGKLLAVTARARKNRKKRRPVIVHRTVTVGNVSTQLAGGTQASVVVTLDAAGRRLLRSRHRLTARLVVSLSGRPLESATVVFKPAGSKRHRTTKNKKKKRKSTRRAIGQSNQITSRAAGGQAPAWQIAAWERIDSAFAPAFGKFADALSSARATVIWAGRRALPATTKRLAQAARAVIPAIGLFDARLARTHFTGDLAGNIVSLRAANAKLIAILHNLDAGTFESQFLVPGNSAVWPVSLEQSYNQLGAALSRDLGRVKLLVL